ncbi:MAG: tRNA lysidine(34) synthetase TilS [Nitriliruptorales bacterium]|nr:tRNA lysidine(34) synthetase TilS [Nitriliruptorales bacterium]
MSGSSDPAPGPLPAGQDRDALLAEVHRALTPIPASAAALVAVSGGPDSTALAFLVAEARPDLDLTLGHVRHGLRPDLDDVAVVRSHASFLGVPLAVTEVTVVPGGQGLEAAARSQRHLALRRQARSAGAGWILFGHTADDQAETILLRLARGTGVSGLVGMSTVRGDLVRPLLRLRRADVHRFVEQEGITAVHDPMNDDPSIRRVAARTIGLPALAELGPDPVGALCRLADLARDDVAKLDADADTAARSLVRSYGPCRAVPVDQLHALEHAIATRVVRDLVTSVRGGDDPPSAAQVSAVLELAQGAALDLPGVHVTRAGGWLAAAPQDVSSPAQIPLTVPGVTRWPATGTRFVAFVPGQVEPEERQLQLDLDGRWRPPELPVDTDALPPGSRPDLGRLTLGDLGGGQQHRLVLRSRRPGDRISVGVGTSKLQDVMVDAGVPRAVRELVPVLVLGDRVVWVPGIAHDQEVAAAGREEPRLHLVVSAAAAPGTSAGQ